MVVPSSSSEVSRGISSSKATSKGTHDRLKALQVAIFTLRSGENDKNWQNVDKCLQVRSFNGFYRKECYERA